MSLMFKNPRQQSRQSSTPATHEQPSALCLVRGLQLGHGLRGFIPRQGPEGLQAIRPCQGPCLRGCGLQAVRPCQGPVLPMLLG